MSLLDRVECADNVALRDDERNKAVRKNLKEALFEEISSEKIASLAIGDLEVASREVKGALDIALKSDEFRVLDNDSKIKMSSEVFDLVLGLGPLQPLLDDLTITEIMVNGSEDVFYEREGKLYRSEINFDDTSQIRVVIDRILGPVGRRVDELSPMVSARLPGGHRANIVVHPVALDGPYITIRKFGRKMFTLGEMVERKTIDSSIATMLKWSVLSRKNIAVSGGTGSGKTTFLNALSCEIPKNERVITIEDSAELRFDFHPHVVRMESRARNTEGKGEITIRDLVINALRMRPDRIVVGECRGAEALDMLQAMNTGHDGSLTTLHANSTQEVANRLITMVRFGMNISKDVVEDQIASALDIVVHLQRCADGSRRVVEVSECRKKQGEGVEFAPCAKWDSKTARYIWNMPSWLDSAVLAGYISNKEVETWKSNLLLECPA